MDSILHNLDIRELSNTIETKHANNTMPQTILTLNDQMVKKYSTSQSFYYIKLIGDLLQSNYLKI